jgi:hypothetical protein
MTSVTRTGFAKCGGSRLHPACRPRPEVGGLASGTLTTRPQRTWRGLA